MSGDLQQGKITYKISEISNFEAKISAKIMEIYWNLW